MTVSLYKKEGIVTDTANEETVTEKPKSILGFLTEVDYPEKELNLYWDPVLADRIYELDRKILTGPSPDEMSKLVKEQEDLIKKAQSTAIKVTIKGTSPRLETDIAKKVLAEAKEKGYKEGTDDFNTYVIERAGLLNAHLKTVKIEVNGEVTSPPTEDDIRILHQELPPTEFERYTLAIASLGDAVEYYKSELFSETF